MKIAIVTGASSGMGREIAYQIGDRFSGIDEIWVAARRGERLWEMSGQIPARVRCFSVDVTEPAGREEIAAGEAGGEVPGQRGRVRRDRPGRKDPG